LILGLKGSCLPKGCYKGIVNRGGAENAEGGKYREIVTYKVYNIFSPRSLRLRGLKFLKCLTEVFSLIAIIDYGMGNLRSVEKAFAKVSVPAQVTSDAEVIRRAPGVVLPGVGAFADCMKHLQEYGLINVVKEVIDAGKPLLGICVGMQILFETGEENGQHQGLGVFGGVIKKISGNLKIPQIGWNNLHFAKDNPLFAGIPDHSYVYFVHSYFAVPTDQDIVAATTTYGQELTVAVQKDNVFAVQFHPEKSSAIGLQMLKNFGGMIK